jgi:hypothetical protein
MQRAGKLTSILPNQDFTLNPWYKDREGTVCLWISGSNHISSLSWLFALQRARREHIISSSPDVSTPFAFGETEQ